MTTLDEIKRVINKHRDELRVEHKIKELAVFGSYARNEQRKKSDVDLLAEFDGPIGLLHLVGAEQYLTKLLRTRVDLIPKNSVRPELKDTIFKEAITI
ncbi:nucleotidyltransferase family protein [Candidatus Magnetobacterium casense]|uniref:nucleotidyltransferase family protein n=1 Tax=Candidatus Magnetobacterium casense TaxID=1455061 RepID=UPI00059136AD|nr:nucleotidyltransferase family protein [Candidatus Magnetobacterium casensis]